MAKKATEQEAKLKKGIAAKLGESGLSVQETIVQVLKKSKKKAGLTIEEVNVGMEKTYGEGFSPSTVAAKLSAKYPTRLGLENKPMVDIEIIEGETAKDRSYKYVGEATEEQVEEWEALIAAKKAEAKAKRDAKKAAAQEEVEEEVEEDDTPAELTKAEKKAAKKAKKAAKKAKKNK